MVMVILVNVLFVIIVSYLKKFGLLPVSVAVPNNVFVFVDGIKKGQDIMYVKNI